MNDWEFMSYVSQLVDVCFADVDAEKKYTLMYTLEKNECNWIIDQVDSFFDTDSFDVDKKVFYLKKSDDNSARYVDGDA